MHQSVVIDVIEGDLLPMHVQAAYHGHRDLLELLKHFFLTHISSSVCAEGVPITCHLSMLTIRPAADRFTFHTGAGALAASTKNTPTPTS